MVVAYITIDIFKIKYSWTTPTCVQGVLPTPPCQIWACVYLFGTPLQEDTRASRATPPKLRHQSAWPQRAGNQTAPSGLGTSSQVTVYAKAMRELGQRCSNVVTASMIMAQHWGSNVSLPSAKCYLYSLSHNHRVCTTGLYSQILPPLITNWIIRA